MKKPRFQLVLAASFAIAESLAASGCDDDPLGLSGNDANIPDASHGGGAGTGGSAGRDSGAPDSDASAGTGASGGADGRADADAGSLDICSRLTDIYTLLNGFVPAFLGAVHADCRVTLLTQGARSDAFAFGQQVRDFSTTLWGCNSNPLSFGLVYLPETLSPEDVAVLIEHYMELALARLNMSPAEAALMRAELERLGQAALTPGASGYSYSACDAGSDAGGGGDADSSSDDDGGGDADSSSDDGEASGDFVTDGASE